MYVTSRDIATIFIIIISSQNDTIINGSFNSGSSNDDVN